MKRLKYTAYQVVDGDTIDIIVNGYPRELMVHSVRVLGIDTEELTDDRARQKKLAIKAKVELQRLMRSFVKPRLYCATVMKKGFRVRRFKTDAYGRLLCTIKIWRWSKLRWEDYADYMIDKNLHKRGSKWNKEV